MKINVKLVLVMLVCGAVVFLGVVSAQKAQAGAVLPAWPDWIVCSMTSGAPNVFYLSLSPNTDTYYYYQEAGQAYTRYDSSGNFVSDDTNVSCNSDSIAVRLTNGGAGNFGGSGDTSSSTSQTVSNPAQDLWNGLILLLLVTFFTVWFFKRH